MTILYEIGNSLYVNMTNKCPCSCTFCLRQTRDHMADSGPLWLEREPSVDEVIADFNNFDIDKYKEIVFCGFGEPTERLDDLLNVAAYIKATWSDKPVRINTNGLSNLIHGESTAHKLEGLIDVVSISLNTPNKERYLELTRSKFGIGSFDAMIKFASDCVNYVPKVILSTVETTLTSEEEDECRRICESIGVTYRIREWED